MTNNEMTIVRDDEIPLGAIKPMLDAKNLPRHLPSFFGENAWMVGMTRRPKVVYNAEEIKDDVSLVYELHPVFMQTDEQKAYTSAIKVQAEQQSISGLRKHAESDKFLVERERFSAFVGTGIELVAYLYIEGEKPDDNTEVYYGPLWQIPVNFVGENKVFDDKALHQLFEDFESAFKMRVNTFVKTLNDGVASYAAVVSQVAQQSAASSAFSLEDEEAAAGLQPMNAEALLAQQQSAALQKIVEVYRNPLKPAPKLKDVFAEAQGLEDLMTKLFDLEAVFGDGVNLTALVDYTLFLISVLTQFTEAPTMLNLPTDETGGEPVEEAGQELEAEAA